MYQSAKESLARWDEQTTDRQKMQHTYIAVAVVLLIVAGVFGLLNQPLGQQVLAIAIASAAVFLVNAVAWALLQSFVLLRLTMTPSKSQSTEKVAKPTVKKPKVTAKKRKS